MSVDKQLKDALGGLGLPLASGVYTREATTYLTYNYDTMPAQFADNRPWMERVLIQVHLVTPVQTALLPLRRRVHNALVRGGFSWPEVVDASEKEVRHLVFECEVLVPVDEGGCSCGG